MLSVSKTDMTTVGVAGVSAGTAAVIVQKMPAIKVAKDAFCKTAANVARASFNAGKHPINTFKGLGDGFIKNSKDLGAKIVNGFRNPGASLNKIKDVTSQSAKNFWSKVINDVKSVNWKQAGKFALIGAAVAGIIILAKNLITANKD